MDSIAQFYTRIHWLNKSDALTTPLGKTNLNRMDSAIKTLDERVVEVCAETIRLDTAKADKTLLNNVLVDWAIDNTSGIVTLTKYNGTTVSINTALNKLAVNFVYDAVNQQLIITQSDGTKQYVDMSALITQYEFLNSDTISFTVQQDGKVTADIIEGSISEKHLRPEYLADIKVEASKAEASAKSASDSADNAAYDAKLSQSYAIGKSGIRDGEDTDNSKYYSEQSEMYKGESEKIYQNCKDVEGQINKKLELAEFDIDDDGNLIYTDNSSFIFTVDSNGNLNWEVKS